jgi:hypothetical protein
VIRAWAVAAFLICPAALMAEVANFSGGWQLNVKRSEWGQKPRPNKVVLNIEHSEPKYKYNGKVESTDGALSTFEFDGAIDGKEYALKDSGATHKCIVRRLSERAISAEVRYADGMTEEFATTRLEPDGKTLTRSIRLKSPQGNVRWREVYERLE